MRTESIILTLLLTLLVWGCDSPLELATKRIDDTLVVQPPDTVDHGAPIRFAPFRRAVSVHSRVATMDTAAIPEWRFWSVAERLLVDTTSDRVWIELRWDKAVNGPSPSIELEDLHVRLDSMPLQQIVDIEADSARGIVVNATAQVGDRKYRTTQSPQNYMATLVSRYNDTPRPNLTVSLEILFETRAGHWLRIALDMEARERQ